MKYKFLLTLSLIFLSQNIFGQKFYNRTTQQINDFTPGREGKILAFGFGNDVILRDMATNQPVQTLGDGHNKTVTSVRIIDNGNKLVSGGRDSVLIFWDLATGTPEKKLKAHKGIITTIASKQSQNVVATAGSDATIYLWEGDDLTRRFQFSGHEDDILDLLFYKDDYLISCGADQNIIVWNIKSVERVNKWKAGEKWLRAIDKVPGRNHIGSCGDAGIVKLWDLNDIKEEKLLLELNISSNWLVSLDYLKPATFVTGGQNRRVLVYHPNGKYVYNPQGNIKKASFVPTEDHGFKLVISAQRSGIFLLEPNDMGAIYY